MAFIKLFPPEDCGALSVSQVIQRLGDEFPVVDADPHAGQDHVAGMIAATLRLVDVVPAMREQLARLQSVQDAAVFVYFGDDLGLVAGCCVMPQSALFFDNPDEIAGPARSLVERAASALGYTLFEG